MPALTFTGLRSVPKPGIRLMPALSPALALSLALGLGSYNLLFILIYFWFILLYRSNFLKNRKKYKLKRVRLAKTRICLMFMAESKMC